MLSPAADPDEVSATDVPIETLADTFAADREAVTDTAVLLLDPAEVTAVLQLDPAEVTATASVTAVVVDFWSAAACWACAEAACEELGPLSPVSGLTVADSVAVAGAAVDAAAVGIVMLVLATTALYCCISMTAASRRTLIINKGLNWGKNNSDMKYKAELSLNPEIEF